MLQPVLVPCKRSADLVLSIDPSDSSVASIYWGTALLQRIPCDSSHPLLRLTAGLLYNLRFPVRKLAACLPLCDKTIRSIGLALRDCCPAELSRTVLGQTEVGGLSEDQKQYVRVRYSELRSNCRDYRKTIMGEVKHIWNVDACGEVLRRCFREADAERNAGVDDAASAGSEQEPDDCTEGSLNAVAADENDPLLASSCEPSSEMEKGNWGCASERSPGTTTRNGTSLFKGAMPCESDPETGCAMPPSAGVDGPESESESATQVKQSVGSAPTAWPLPFPYLPNEPQWCAHAGLFTLLPWLEEGLGGTALEVQQLALQILAGAVNHEGSRYTSFDSLKLLGEPVHRAMRSQRAWCKAHAFDGVLETVLLGNAKLARLCGESVFYFDPHTERYTGQLKTLLAWCGSLHGVAKGLHLDFIHTQYGFPCYIRHFDNCDDMRRRFLVSRKLFKKLFKISGPTTWVADRGIWSKDFLADLALLLDRFVTWEKGYSATKQSKWDHRFVRSGKFSKWRCRNSREDRYRYVFAWREQPWDAVPHGRRFIVRARKPGGATIEVSIVTNDNELAPEQVIWLMFNRWIQENDFAYLRRHFGIDELTERGFDRYGDIASDLQDREVDSRAYKRGLAQRKELERELAAALMDRRAAGEVQDTDALRAESDALRGQLATLTAELDQIRAMDLDSVSLEALAHFGDALDQVGQRVRDNRAEKLRATKAARLEARTQEVEQQIEQLNARLKDIPRKESRLAVLVEENYVRLRMRAKPLVDAVRITCRNVFRHPLNIFRPIFDNRRTDHAILRSLTRAPGLVSATPERIDVRLLPAMTIEPAERARIRAFLDICEHRAAAMAALRDGPALRFDLLLDDTEINKFLRRL